MTGAPWKSYGRLARDPTPPEKINAAPTVAGPDFCIPTLGLILVHRRCRCQPRRAGWVASTSRRAPPAPRGSPLHQARTPDGRLGSAPGQTQGKGGAQGRRPGTAGAAAEAKAAEEARAAADVSEPSEAQLLAMVMRSVHVTRTRVRLIQMINRGTSPRFCVCCLRVCRAARSSVHARGSALLLTRAWLARNRRHPDSGGTGP